MTEPTITPQNTTLVEPGVYKMDLGVGSDGVTPSIKYVNARGENLPNYTPTMQTTTQQDRKDAEIGKKIDTMAGTTPQASAMQNANGATPQAGTGTTTPAVNPDGTPKAIKYKAPDGVTDIEVTDAPAPGSYTYKAPLPELKDGEKVGYGKDGKRYIIGKDGKTRNDTFADQEYSANEASIKKEQERTALYDSLKLNLDQAHNQLLDSIKATFSVRKAKMEDINKRYLALKQNEGFSGGQARYMSDINNGVLQDEEEKGNMRLAELDAQEKTLIAQAVQAKTSKDFELAFKKVDELDKIQKEKQDTIQAVYNAAVEYNKALDEQEKALRTKEKEQFDLADKRLKTTAPILVKAYDQLKTQKERDEFIKKYAKQLGTGEDMVLGAMEDQRMQNKKDVAEINQKNRSNTGGGSDNPTANTVFADINKAIIDNISLKGVPILDKNGFINPQAFEVLVQVAARAKVTRKQLFEAYKGKLYSENGDYTAYGIE